MATRARGDTVARGPVAVIGLLAVMALLGLSSAASAATIHVANNGLDSPTCGAAATPCRSISQALVVAGAEPAGRRVPRILVGPGRYGDLDGDGALTGPGEEFSGVAATCSCMILVARPAEIESTHGAALTVLVGIHNHVNAVQVTSSHVQFGKEKKGFTVMRGQYGILAGPHHVGDAPLAKVSTAGNLAVMNTFGIAMFTIDGVGLNGNVAIGNIDGVWGGPGSQRVSDNIAIANIGWGIMYSGGGGVTKNVASANGDSGFFYNGGHDGELVLFASNVAAGNREGFAVSPLVPPLVLRRFTGNSAIGNLGPGLVMGIGTIFERGNIYGNGVAPPVPPFQSNCGLQTGDTGGSVHAAHDFWGAPTGPGPDPADEACEGLTLATTTPFAPTRLPIAAPNPW